MLLRRLSQHVKDQNWFAVGLDFVIVVLGVFVGIQVSNWNDAVRLQSLEQSYLVRLSEELTTNVENFETEIEFSEQSREAIKGFLVAIQDPSTPDAEIIRHTVGFVSTGTFLAKMDPSYATFDELTSTGNLDILSDAALREQLVSLHSYYAQAQVSFRTNFDWVLPVDSETYLRFDALRFDDRTADLFVEMPTAETAAYVRENMDMLRRHAALHYWLKDRAIELLQEASQRSTGVIEQIAASQPGAAAD